MQKRLLTIGFLLFLTACGESSGPETFPATGVVTMDGSPVIGALVVFAPKDFDDTTKLAAQAETGSDGAFTLQTYLGGEDYKAGVESGEYVVTVTKLEVVQDMRSKPKHLLPQKYSMPGKTDLSATVKATGDNSFEFDLSK